MTSNDGEEWVVGAYKLVLLDEYPLEEELFLMSYSELQEILVKNDISCAINSSAEIVFLQSKCIEINDLKCLPP